MIEGPRKFSIILVFDQISILFLDCFQKKITIKIDDHRETKKNHKQK